MIYIKLNKTGQKMAQTRKRTSNYSLTKEQVKALLDGVRHGFIYDNEKIQGNFRDFVMLEMGIYTGCRVGELENLRVANCDFNLNEIRVWDNKHNKWKYSNKLNPANGRRMKESKVSEGKWRTISVPKRVMADLKTYIERNPTQIQKVRHDNYKVPDGGQEGETKYVWDLSRPTWERTVHKWTGLILKSSRSWHTLRHVYMSLHLESKSDLAFIMAQTGDTAATILNVYAQVSPDARRKQAEKDLLEL